ncbi:DMT family transporter [Candidatus Peregrinibacteria bacterium]|nr:DMT family transporter [Candidatus Peregrinibacteria bacterium]MBI2524174.1 DMT family transporter [Candidatus Peregrinibacteria bacterium]
MQRLGDGVVRGCYDASMPQWFLYSLVVMVGWGVWGFFGKLASHTIGPFGAVFYTMLGWVFMVGILTLFRGIPFPVAGRGAFFSFIVGIIASLVFIPFILALSKGRASMVVTVTALYPLVTLILAFLFLHETITVRQCFGVLLAILAVILLKG